MTALEKLRNLVERELTRWAEEPLDGDGQLRTALQEDTVVQVSRVVDPAVESGFRFQRCGGGRRIIRATRKEG